MRFSTARTVAALVLAAGLALTAPIAAHAAVTLPGAVRVQADVPGPSWTGTWYQSGTSAASGGVRAVSASTGARVVAAFDGTAISVIAERGPSWGKTDIYIDGVKSRTVDLYASGIAKQKAVFKATGLNSGRHTVTLVATGTKNAKARSSRINVDAFDIVGTAAPAATYKRVDQSDSRLFWDGPWTSSSVTGSSGGTVRSSASRGAEMTVEFSGTGVTVVGSRGPSLGRATVILDGKTWGTISSYAPSVTNQRTLMSVAGLPSGRHALTIRVEGAKDPASKGTVVAFDAFDVRGGDAVIGWVRAEQTDARLTHAGNWVATSSSRMSGSSYVRASGAGAVYRVRFKGSAVRIVAPKASTFGQVEVICDGVSRSVDLYASSTRARSRVLTISGLSATATHNVEIRATGVRSSFSHGDISAVDAIDVRGTFVQAPVARAFVALDADRADIALSKAWYYATSSSSSGGRIAKATGANHTATVAFDGPGARIIAQRGPSSGKASVYLDGKVVAELDLYAPSTRSRSVVWSDASLGDSAHTLTIKTTGKKHPSSTGTLFALDRIEVTGTSAEPPLPSGTVRLQDDDPRVLRTGVWSSYSNSQSEGGAHSASRDCLAIARVKFTGTSITWIGGRARSYGRAYVYLDGKRVATLDNYNSSTQYGRVLWKATGLKDTTHSLRIEVAASLAQGSSYWVPIDAFDVTGSIVQPTITYDQHDYHIGATGAWSTIGREGAVGGDIRRASKPATMTVAFTGTRVSLISEVGPLWGVAHVSIDGGAAQDVVLTRETTATARTVFSRGGLASGTHTLTFSWLPQSHAPTPPPTNRVNLDAVETGGPLVGATPSSRARDTIVRTAVAQLGDPYVWGATGPDSFDCSGLVRYSYVAANMYVPRVSRDQWKACAPKSISELQPGDLVFRDRPSYIHHVGIYIGNGMVIHAPSSGRNVEYTKASAFGCFGRMATSYWPTK